MCKASEIQNTSAVCLNFLRTSASEEDIQNSCESNSELWNIIYSFARMLIWTQSSKTFYATFPCMFYPKMGMASKLKLLAISANTFNKVIPVLMTIRHHSSISLSHL